MNLYFMEFLKLLYFLIAIRLNSMKMFIVLYIQSNLTFLSGLSNMPASKFVAQKPQSKSQSNIYSTVGLNINSIQKSKQFQPLGSQTLKGESLRLNVISKENRSQKISIIVKSSLLVSHLKRRIQNQFFQAQDTQFLIRVIQDQNGFIFSNNSPIGEYVQSGETVYIQIQQDKKGANMNLPNNISDLFVTLRYVSSSILQKLHNLPVQLSPSDLISELLHLGYWQSNSQIVISLLKLLRKSAQNQIQMFQIRQNQLKNQSLLNFMNFWFFQVDDSYSIYPDICFEIITLLQTLTMSQMFKNLLKNNRIIKAIVQQSKNPNQSSLFKRSCLNIIKNINKRGGLNTGSISNKLQYVPTIYEDSYQEYSLQEVLDMLNISDSQSSNANQKALQILSRTKNKLVLQSTITFQNYRKILQGLLKIKRPSQKRILNQYDIVFRELVENTTPSRCIQLSNQNFLKIIHQYLLQASSEMHRFVYNFTKYVLQEVSKKGQLNISSTVQYINSPYNQFQTFVCQAIQRNNSNQAKNLNNYARYLPYIKDFIKLTLKTDNQIVSKCMLKILSMICIDQQCRFQVINLKGIQVFIKCLLSSYKTKNIEAQRACGKGLLNLAVSSKQTKTKILSQMQEIIELYYKNAFDSVTQGYIQTVLKPLNKY